MTTQFLPADRRAEPRTLFAVLGAISLSHLLNDTIQSLIPAIYPILKTSFDLTFGQIGLITFRLQFTASLLQPAVGWFTDRRPRPYSLVAGMTCSLAGLLLLSVAVNLTMLLIAAGLVGLGSSVFHPESSRIARMASGGRHGLAQSLFQAGGNLGSNVRPASGSVRCGPVRPVEHRVVFGCGAGGDRRIVAHWPVVPRPGTRASGRPAPTPR